LVRLQSNQLLKKTKVIGSLTLKNRHLSSTSPQLPAQTINIEILFCRENVFWHFFTRLISPDKPTIAFRIPRDLTKMNYISIMVILLLR
jgi:hypothetical protein